MITSYPKVQIISQIKEIDEKTTEVILQLLPSAESFQLWSHKFELLLSIIVGQELALSLTTKNGDALAFEITEALHCYYSIENISNVHIEGLADKLYFDSVTGKEYQQQGNVTISREVDRIYRKVDYPVSLHDRSRTISIDARGSASAIVWNPWQEKSTAMTDMEDDSYKTMLCVKTTNAPDAIQLAPGEQHTLTSIVSWS